MLSSRTSPKRTRRDTKRSQAPVVIRKGALNQVTKSRPNVAVSIKEAPQMEIGRDCAARAEDLGPPGAGTEQTDSALSIRKLADGGQESPGLTDTTAEQVLAPARGPPRGSQKLEIGRPNPSTTRKVPRSKRLGRRARRDDLGFVKIDLESNTPEAANQGRKKVPHRRGRTGAEPVIEVKGANVNPTWVSSLRGSTGLHNDRWMASAKRTGPRGSPC